MTNKELKYRLLQNYQFLLAGSVESNPSVPIEKKEEVLSHLEDFINLCRENYKLADVVEIMDTVVSVANLFQDFIHIRYGKYTIQ